MKTQNIDFKQVLCDGMYKQRMHCTELNMIHATTTFTTWECNERRHTTTTHPWTKRTGKELEGHACKAPERAATEPAALERRLWEFEYKIRKRERRWARSRLKNYAGRRAKEQPLSRWILRTKDQYFDGKHGKIDTNGSKSDVPPAIDDNANVLLEYAVDRIAGNVGEGAKVKYFVPW